MVTKKPISTRTKAPTIRDVARVAKVSIGTASKALNANGRLSTETREKVKRVAAEIGYRPNDLAQSLHRSKSMTVGVITNDSFGRFSFPIFEALEERLAAEGIAVFMCNATDDPERERQHLDQLLGKRIDGLVVTARRTDNRAPIGRFAHGLPVIYVFTHADEDDAHSLLPDDEGGAYLATAHLASLGRKHIVHVTGPERFEAVRLRLKGYRRALKDNGLDEQVHHGPWSEVWGREAAAKLFSNRTQKPDALFCGNDQIARGAAEGLRDLGIQVPRDVAIVGFDNWEVITQAARPPLTSIDMNLKVLGTEAGERLIAMIGGQKIRGAMRMPCSLVIRQSCGSEIGNLSEV
ncbi:MAG TPA: LacI family DNA-binding transcriptional regulator [Aestuariivirga sp.]